jgi:hypothetical protein
MTGVQAAPPQGATGEKDPGLNLWQADTAPVQQGTGHHWVLGQQPPLSPLPLMSVPTARQHPPCGMTAVVLCSGIAAQQ